MKTDSKARVQFDFSKESLNKLDILVTKTGVSTRAELIRRALALYSLSGGRESECEAHRSRTGWNHDPTCAPLLTSGSYFSETLLAVTPAFWPEPLRSKLIHLLADSSA